MQPVRSLSDEVCNRLAEEITSGKLAGGAKLPSEQEMMTAMGKFNDELKAAGMLVTAAGVQPSSFGKRVAP